MWTADTLLAALRSDDSAERDKVTDAIVMALREPVTFAGETYTEIRLREPTGAEWLVFDKLSGAEQNIKAIATVAAMPEPAVKQIGSRDIIAASRFLDRFF